ncbi:MAG: AAA family ATPase [Oenococcus oeni]
MSTDELIRYIYNNSLKNTHFNDDNQQKGERALILLTKYGYEAQPKLEAQFKEKVSFNNITPKKAIQVYKRIDALRGFSKTNITANSPTDTDYVNFKKILGYFVHILRANNPKNPEKFNGNEPKSGQGHKKQAIFNSYKNFRNFSNNQTMDVNVASGYQLFQKTCYIHWSGTAENVRCIWNDKKDDVFALRLCTNSPNKPSNWVGRSFTINELGLQDTLKPNDKLKEFYNHYLELLTKSSQESPIVKELSDKLFVSKNIILRGAPGTGKTYLARQIAMAMTGIDEHQLDKCNQYGFVQFHPGYDYTDFIEGLRPVVDQESGQLSFKLVDGIFKKFCQEAIRAKEEANDKKFVFVIDEINRGEISKIFGELFFSIDPGYRGNQHYGIRTQYANLHQDPREKFYIPDNVYIIGTMNDIDRSVDSFDFAMRRRFRFIEIQANENRTMLDELGNKKEEAIKRMDALNREIVDVDQLDENYEIGAAYFLKLQSIDFDQLWQDYLEPLLREYIRGLYDETEIMQKFNQAYNLKKPEVRESNVESQEN